ncbi:MAG: type II secretion system protein [Clostridiaceae bacterium]|nr:type II secretion system protein [Clostridiaceae bacterium]
MKRDRVLINSKGFSLIEVIVSVAILGIIALPLTMMFVSAVRQNEEAKRKTEAYQLANMLMEKIKQIYPLNEVDTYVYYDASLNGIPSSDGIEPANARYKVKINITHKKNEDAVARGMPVPIPDADIIYDDYSSEGIGEITEEIYIYQDYIEKVDASGNIDKKNIIVNTVAVKKPRDSSSIVTVKLYNRTGQDGEERNVTVFKTYDEYTKGKIILENHEGNFVFLNDFKQSSESTDGMTVDDYDIVITVYDAITNRILANLNSNDAMYK